MNTTERKAVDVLAVMDDSVCGMEQEGVIQHLQVSADALREARAAVAELVAACEARDRAYGFLIDAEIRHGQMSPQTNIAHRDVTEANLRYYAALARVQGGQ